MGVEQFHNVKCAEWVDGSVLPTRIGVYEVADATAYGFRQFAYWDGVKFCFRCTDPDNAFDDRGWPTLLPAPDSWRGVLDRRVLSDRRGRLVVRA